MSNLGIGPPPPHHSNAQQNMRLAQQSMAAAMSPQMIQNMRLSPQTNLPSTSMSGGQRQTPPTVPISSPQNLSMSPSATCITSSASSLAQNQTTPHSLSPNSPEKITSRSESTEQTPEINDSKEIRATMTKDSALNMSMNNSDMRTNSIATLRIKAKEHLESINKGLTMV